MKIDAEKLGRVDAAVGGLARRLDAFEESKHPRAANGQFGSGGGGSAAAPSGGGKAGGFVGHGPGVFGGQGGRAGVGTDQTKDYHVVESRRHEKLGNTEAAAAHKKAAHLNGFGYNRMTHNEAKKASDEADRLGSEADKRKQSAGGKMTLPQAPEGASKEEKNAHFDKLGTRMQSPAYSHHAEQSAKHGGALENHGVMRDFHAGRAGEDPRHAEAMYRHEDAAAAHEAAMNAHRAEAQAVLNGEKSNRASADEHSKKAQALGKLAHAASRLTERKRADEHEGFQKLEHKLAHEKGVTDPAALAAAIGREKYGAKGMAAKAAAGRREAAK